MPRQISPSAGALTMPSSGTPVGYQRQIDGEFVAAGDEFLGAVERVDQEEAVSIGRRGLLGALFRQRRYVRRQSRQTFGDDAVGGQIRLRYRRSVGLAVDLHGGTVDGEDGGASLDHEVGQRLDQFRGGVAIDVRADVPHS